MNQARRTMLEKQGRAHQWMALMDPAYGRAKARRPARTYIQQLCEDTGCSPEDLQEAMNDWEKWRERVRDIRTGGTTWWWWFIFEIMKVSWLLCEQLTLGIVLYTFFMNFKVRPRFDPTFHGNMPYSEFL